MINMSKVNSFLSKNGNLKVLLLIILATLVVGIAIYIAVNKHKEVNFTKTANNNELVEVQGLVTTVFFNKKTDEYEVQLNLNNQKVVKIPIVFRRKNIDTNLSTDEKKIAIENWLTNQAITTSSLSVLSPPELKRPPFIVMNLDK